MLSPVLYAVFIDDIARRLAASCSGVSVGGEVVRLRLYADDICLSRSRSTSFIGACSAWKLLYLNARLSRKNVIRSLNDYTSDILSRVV